MGFDLKRAVETVAGAAGWNAAEPDGEGVCHYLLDGLDLDMSSPDGRTLILSADLGGAPQADAPGVDDEWRRIGGLAAAVMKRRASVLAVHDGRLELFRRVDLVQADAAGLVGACRDFLNDEAWWRANLEGGASAYSASTSYPFDFSQGWFPGQLTF